MELAVKPRELEYGSFQHLGTKHIAKLWREDWLHELKKYRVTDSNFQRQIENDKVFTCEKHFHENDIEITVSEKMTKKRPKFGALPLLSMPQKSFQKQPPTPRPLRSIVKEDFEVSDI